MSEQPDDSAGEIIENDLTAYSVDDEDQLQPEDSLDDRGVADLLDEGFSPPERPRGVNAFGTTAAEQARGESFEQRLAQEEPDPAAAFDDPLATPEDMVGGDDPDAIAAEDDFLGDPEVGAARAGRLVAPDEGAREDAEKDMVASDVGIDGAGASAEEAAMHVITEPDSA
ncbi:MAG TPA: DUF5709 domain-containing protein [Dermatophilaceae bacterium]|nr:DUF5709 domain-containing protein [Dermatophilaceae bacterium]